MPQLTRRDICRLAFDSRLTARELGKLGGISPTTAGKYRRLLAIAGATRESLDSMSDAELNAIIQADHKGNQKTFVEPDWNQVYADYQKRDVTVSLLYAEYIETAKPTDREAVLSESSFGRKLRDYCAVRGVSMRQEHVPGQEMFVDFSGKHLYLTDPKTGERTPVELFVASLGASQLIYVTVVPSQQKADWIEANTRALEYYGGAPAMIVPDNLKSAVITPGGKGRDPVLNRSYVDFAEHYDVVILPARRVHPKDKALAEIGVRITNIWIIARLRNHVFHDISEIHQQLRPLVERINEKRSRRLKGRSRRELFDEIEAPCLNPLPGRRHEYTEWNQSIRVPKDYHLSYRGDFYSVPAHCVGKTVNFCVSRTTIKIYAADSSAPIAVHALGNGKGQNITNKEHMPEAHRMYHAQNVGDLLEWASDVGPDVHQLFEAIVANKRIPPISAIRQMSKAQKMAQQYGRDRLVSACKRANAVNVQTVDSVQNILKHDIDLRPNADDPSVAARPIPHENIRGAAAFTGDQ